MTICEEVLTPISGDNPSGSNVRYTSEYAEIHSELKTARLQDDKLPQGELDIERKPADLAAAVSLSRYVLSTKGKHLQVAAWMTEALIHEEGFSGLCVGLDSCAALLDKFWDSIYPAQGEEGDWEGRAEPLQWMGDRLGDAVKKVPLNSSGANWYRFRESRQVGYEKDSQTELAKKSREKAIKEGKLTAESFDKAFAVTPKVFYALAEKNLDGSLASLAKLQSLCNEKFTPPKPDPGQPKTPDYTPSFAVLNSALEEVRRDLHGLLEKKRVAEPDAVEAVPEKAVETPAESVSPIPEASTRSEPLRQGAVSKRVPFPLLAAVESVDQGEAVAAVSAAAAHLRSVNPHSPAAYLMLRGWRWGELRAALADSDPTLLEAPSTEIRQQVRQLALNHQWKELLEFCEGVMALPCSRAWLDMQRFVVEACTALGDDYNTIALALCSELRALVRDFPSLLDARMMDDTAVANRETQAWLLGLLAEPEKVVPNLKAAADCSDGHAPGWRRNFIDSSILASNALKSGEQQKAFEIMSKELDRQRSGRGRFQRKLQLVQLCVTAGKEAIAQPLLDDIMTSIDSHKLEEWEDRELIAGALAAVMQSSKKIQGDAKEKQKLFERICRLDPVQALSN